MKEFQQEVRDFSRTKNLEGTTTFRIMDLVAEVGEIVKDATKSADYGMSEEELKVKEDELGDALFSLCMVANDLDIDLEEALVKAMEKYEARIEEKGDPGSGRVVEDD